MKHQSIRELFAYWNDLRGERAAPERNDIDPNAIRHILADTFMLDIDVERNFPFRLAGTRVNALFATDQKGQSFLRRWRPEEAHNLGAILMTVADGACPVVAGAAAAPANQRESAFELLFLPVRHEGRTHARLLGMIKPATTPTWLGAAPIGPLSLRSLRVIEGDQLVVANGGKPETPRPRAANWRGIRNAIPRERPALTVIEGGAASGPRTPPPRERLKIL
jgi:hypothetical protein